MTPDLFLGYALYAVAGSYILWLYFLASMNLLTAKANGTLSKTAMIIGAPIIIVGLLIDFVVNVTIMSVVFFEAPSEWLVTQRLKRHVNFGTDWRAKLAEFICTQLLDRFDPSGCHCCKR